MLTNGQCQELVNTSIILTHQAVFINPQNKHDSKYSMWCNLIAILKSYRYVKAVTIRCKRASDVCDAKYVIRLFVAIKPKNHKELKSMKFSDMTVRRQL